jgi:hypothetical protein
MMLDNKNRSKPTPPPTPDQPQSTQPKLEKPYEKFAEGEKSNTTLPFCVLSIHTFGADK